MTGEPRHVAGADSATTNFFSVNAKGEVTAQFEGKIIALGFVLKEGLTSTDILSTLEWESPQPFAGEKIIGYRTNANHHVLNIYAAASANRFLSLRSEVDNKTGEERLIAENFTTKRLILDETGGSDFVVKPAIYQTDLELFGAEPLSADAFHIDLSYKEYLPPGDAFSASVRAVEGTNTGRILRAYWDVAWNPRGKKGNGIQLYTFEGEAFGSKEPIAVTPESVSETPVHITALITAVLQERWAKAKANNSYIQIGYQVKTDAAAVNSPIMFSNYVVIQWEIQ